MTPRDPPDPRDPSAPYNLVRPFRMRGGLGLHPLLVFVAVIGGIASCGFAGVFLGPLVLALPVAALDIYEGAEEGGGERAEEASPAGQR